MCLPAARREGSEIGAQEASQGSTEHAMSGKAHLQASSTRAQLSVPTSTDSKAKPAIHNVAQRHADSMNNLELQLVEPHGTCMQTDGPDHDAEAEFGQTPFTIYHLLITICHLPVTTSCLLITDC